MPPMNPLVSVVSPLDDPHIGLVGEMIDSVLAQTFTDFELVLVVDQQSGAQVRDLVSSGSRKDGRIQIIERSFNGGPVAAANDGLAAAVGDFVVLLEQHDLLAPSALAQVAKVIGESDDVDCVYSDEDTIDSAGRRLSIFRKPDWSPERLRGQMYVSHLWHFAPI
jgi:glycosyltransferase involved in cell wall biosynthesis